MEDANDQLPKRMRTEAEELTKMFDHGSNALLLQTIDIG